VSGIGPGDLVVCVDASPCKCCGINNPSLQIRKVYRVLRITQCRWFDGTAGIALGLAGHRPLLGHQAAVNAERFRKLNDGEEDQDLIAKIKACKPVRRSVDA
jgi:hypothetical protein